MENVIYIALVVLALIPFYIISDFDSFFGDE